VAHDALRRVSDLRQRHRVRTQAPFRPSNGGRGHGAGCGLSQWVRMTFFNIWTLCYGGYVDHENGSSSVFGGRSNHSMLRNVPQQPSRGFLWRHLPPQSGGDGPQSAPLGRRRGSGGPAREEGGEGPGRGADEVGLADAGDELGQHHLGPHRDDLRRRRGRSGGEGRGEGGGVRRTMWGVGWRGL